MIMKKEETIYDQENTGKPVSLKKDPGNQQVSQFAGVGAIGLGTGVAMGAVAPSIARTAEQLAQNDVEIVETQHPDWTDGQVAVATTVSEDMSFSQAFNAARAEVGSGGVFEWRGNIYNTYTNDEWNHMSAAQRAEYGSHFNYNNHSQANSHSTAATNEQDSSSSADNDEQITEKAVAEDYDDAQADVEVLGVIHDDSTGYNYTGVNIDGQDVVLIDVDGDLNADYAAADLDNNGKIDTDEIVDLQGVDIPMMDNDSIASAEPDYLVEGGTEYGA